MNRGVSLYLDLLRVIAAFLVFFSHLGYQRFTGGDLFWIRNLNLGSDAVILFFVLSGFVMAFSTTIKHRTLSDYTISRSARLYSVVVPAILFMILADSIGRYINPGVYTLPWYNEAPISEQIFRSLTFSSHAFGDVFRVGTNGPFWSVVYEAWYYAALGIFLFSRGILRVILLVIWAMFAGINILLLLPCWLAGVYLYKRIGSRNGSGQDTPKILNFDRKPIYILAAIVPVIIYILALIASIPNILTAITYLSMGQKLTPGQAFGFSDEFLWSYILAFLVVLHLWGMCNLTEKLEALLTRYESPIRWIAGGTFSLYLFHYPILQCLHTMPGFESTKLLHQLGLAITTIILCYLLAEISERRLKVWRKLFSNLFARVESICHSIALEKKDTK